MVLHYTTDPNVIAMWSQRCAKYRRRTSWLWVLALVATIVPIALVTRVGASAFPGAFAIFAVGILMIGVVLARETRLLFCPHCGRRPVALSGMHQSALYVKYCVHCGFWLREPDAQRP